MTATTQTTIHLTDDGATVTVQVKLCGRPRKTLPPVVDTYAEPIEDWSNVVQLPRRNAA